MKKIQAKTLSEFFGKNFPIAKLNNPALRKEIILISISLRKYGKEIDDETEALRMKYVEGHEEEVEKWSKLIAEANAEKDEKKKAELFKKAEAMTEVAQINREYIEALNAMLGEEMDCQVRKIDITDLIDALTEVQMLTDTASMESVIGEFEPILKDM